MSREGGEGVGRTAEGGLNAPVTKVCVCLGVMFLLRHILAMSCALLGCAIRSATTS